MSGRKKLTDEERLEKERKRGRDKYYATKAKNLAKGADFCKNLLEKQNEKDRIRYANNLEHRTKKHAAARKYRIENKEELSKKKKKTYLKNRDKILKKIKTEEFKENRRAKRKTDRKNNPEKVRAKDRERYHKSKDKTRERRIKNARTAREKNREERNKKANAIRKEKRKNDPAFKLRDIVSRSVLNALKKAGSSKKGQSCMKYLPFSETDIVIHIQKQFEPWMNWSNHGIYDYRTWDDNNSSTWTWQLDHIIPQSKLPSVSMEDENFKKCWALDNLRPYSAKLNVSEGDRR